MQRHTQGHRETDRHAQAQTYRDTHRDIERDRETDRHAETHTHKHSDGQMTYTGITHLQTYRDTKGHRERQTDRHTETHTHKHSDGQMTYTGITTDIQRHKGTQGETDMRTAINVYFTLPTKNSPYSITERRVPELIPVLGS